MRILAKLKGMNFTVPRHFYCQIKSVIYITHWRPWVGMWEWSFVYLLWLNYPSSLSYEKLLIQESLVSIQYSKDGFRFLAARVNGSTHSWAGYLVFRF